MQEPSVSGRGGAEGGCSELKFWASWQGCGVARLLCCVDRGGQLCAAGQSRGALGLEFSEMSASVPNINRLLLALHPLSEKKMIRYVLKHSEWTIPCTIKCQVQLHLLCMSHLLIIKSLPVLSEASCLPAAVWQSHRCVNTDNTACQVKTAKIGLSVYCRQMLRDILVWKCCFL